MTHTYTVVELSVSAQAYDEIRAKLREAGYDHCFKEARDDREMIDMNGIALVKEDGNETTDKDGSATPA